MTDVAWGVIGTIAGTLIGFSLTAIKDWMNSTKPLYIEFSEIGFSFPQLTEDNLVGEGRIYLYNSSTSHKSFFLTKLEYFDSDRYIFEFNLSENGNSRPLEIVSVNPGMAVSLKLTTKYYANPDQKVPELKKTGMIVTYKTGKKSKEANLTAFYSWPE